MPSSSQGNARGSSKGRPGPPVPVPGQASSRRRTVTKDTPTSDRQVDTSDPFQEETDTVTDGATQGSATGDMNENIQGPTAGDVDVNNDNASSDRVQPPTPGSHEHSSIKDKYPRLFLPLTRANAKVIAGDKKHSVTFQWKDGAGRGRKYSDQEILNIKANCDYELRKHFIVFGCGMGIGWIIETLCPELDLSSNQFRNLRKYCLNLYGGLKHDFLFERLYSHVNRLMKDYPTIMLVDTKDPAKLAQLKEWLKGRVDSNTIRFIYGNSTFRIMNAEKTFYSTPNVPLWYLTNIFVRFTIALIPLIRSEADKNSGRTWEMIPHRPRGWKTDSSARDSIGELWESMCVAQKFHRIELDTFTWVNRSQLEESRRPAPPKAKTLLDIANEGFSDDEPPFPGESSSKPAAMPHQEKADAEASPTNDTPMTDPSGPDNYDASIDDDLVGLHDNVDDDTDGLDGGDAGSQQENNDAEGLEDRTVVFGGKSGTGTVDEDGEQDDMSDEDPEPPQSGRRTRSEGNPTPNSGINPAPQNVNTRGGGKDTSKPKGKGKAKTVIKPQTQTKRKTDTTTQRRSKRRRGGQVSQEEGVRVNYFDDFSTDFEYDSESDTESTVDERDSPSQIYLKRAQLYRAGYH